MIKVTLPLLIVGFALGGETHQFSHYQHVKTEELVCSDCHTKSINSTTLAGARVGLTLKSCVDCHDDDSNFLAPKPIVLVDPSFRVKRTDDAELKFNHKSHFLAKVECASCHGELVAPSEKGHAPIVKNLLSMRNCMECHLQKAEISCLTCHTKVNKPLNHMSKVWLRGEGHGLESNLNNEDCSLCHEKGEVTTCAECHYGNDARKVHGLNYRLNHGLDVKFKKSDCSACHTPLDQFCSDCHEGKGRKLR